MSKVICDLVDVGFYLVFFLDFCIWLCPGLFFFVTLCLWIPPIVHRHCPLVHACSSIPCVSGLSAITKSAKVGPVTRPRLVTLPLGTLCCSKFCLPGPSDVGWWPTIVLISLELDPDWIWSCFGTNWLKIPVRPCPCLALWALFIWAWQVAQASEEA